MKANITSGRSFYGTLAYNKLKVDNGEAKLLLANGIFEDGNDKQMHY